MTYLSRRMREIREEEARRKERARASARLTPYNEDGSLDHSRAITVNFANLVYDPMADSYRDEAFHRMRERTLAAYEETLRARNPMGYTSPIDFTGRAG